MRNARAVKQKKRRRGRPATGTAKGATPIVGVRLDPALTRQVDDYAKDRAITRSHALRLLVELALGKGK